MCFELYLGSYTECPEIPYAERSDDPTQTIDLFVHKYPEHPEASEFMRAVVGLTTPYHYHLGVMSCGCGFAYDFPVNSFDDGGWTRNNHRQLGNYVATCLQKSEPIELLSCWDGDEPLPVEKHRQITVGELSDPQFYFENRQLTVVYKDEVSLDAARRLVNNTD